jgi:predicted dehydrogenase
MRTHKRLLMDDLRVGILGFGLRSGLARYANRPGEGSRIVAVCDPRPERQTAARERLGDDIAVTGDLDGFLAANLDAVFILSPDYLHEQHTIAVLEAGAAAYVEKPMATTTEGCDAMLATAARTGSRLYVGHNMRHMPVIRQMRQLVADGAIGRVTAVWCRHFVGHGGDYYFKDWHAERAKSTGLLLQKGAHDIDVIHWLAGGYTRRVTAMGALTVYGQVADRAPAADYLPSTGWSTLDTWPPLAQTGLNPVIDVEDLSMMTMALDNGVFATYEQCHYTPDYWRNYTVIGTEGRLENIGDDADGGRIGLWNRRHLGQSAPDVAIPVEEAKGGHGGADPSIVAEFLRYVRDGGETVTDPFAAREAVAAGCAATMSLRAGGVPVDIAPPTVGA